MKSIIRMQKIESALHTAISEALPKLDIDNCIITRVELGSDMRNAKIFYIVGNKTQSSELVLSVLNANKSSIAKEIMKTFHGRVFPKISFLFDKGFHESERINKLLDNLPSPVEQNLEY